MSLTRPDKNAASQYHNRRERARRRTLVDADEAQRDARPQSDVRIIRVGCTDCDWGGWRSTPIRTGYPLLIGGEECPKCYKGKVIEAGRLKEAPAQGD